MEKIKGRISVAETVAETETGKEPFRVVGFASIGITHYSDHPIYGDGGLTIGGTIDKMIAEQMDGQKPGSQLSEITIRFERDA